MQLHKKTIIRRSLIALGIVFVLFMSLGVHLYYVTDNFYTPKGPQLQLARIDFQAPLEEPQIAAVRSTVQSLPGVTKAYYNANDHILVYAYTIGEQDQQYVFDHLMRSGNYPAQRFIADQTASSGCPVMMDERSPLLTLYKNMFALFI